MNQETKHGVSSNQTTIHSDLRRVVTKHRQSKWQEPITPYAREASRQILSLIDMQGGPIILDSFCGTGMSTAKIAAENPRALVIGIDKSVNRLSKHVPSEAANYRLIRGSCEQIWAGLVAAGVRCSQHYMLYPNPWPKKSHLKRRIHGHPSFPLLCELSEVMEVRSNWKIYVDEFAAASEILGLNVNVQPLSVNDPLTLFERKYSANSEQLWTCRTRLSTSN